MLLFTYIISFLYLLLLMVKFIADSVYCALLNRVSSTNNGQTISNITGLFKTKTYKLFSLITYSIGVVSILTIGISMLL